MGLTPDETKKYIVDNLNAQTIIPDGHRGAFVIFYDEAGARTAVAVRVKDGWEINGNLAWHSQEKGLSYGVNVMKTW